VSHALFLTRPTELWLRLVIIGPEKMVFLFLISFPLRKNAGSRLFVAAKLLALWPVCFPPLLSREGFPCRELRFLACFFFLDDHCGS